MVHVYLLVEKMIESVQMEEPQFRPLAYFVVLVLDFFYITEHQNLGVNSMKYVNETKYLDKDY